MGDYINILRPHHWIKNLLIIFPIIASHQIDFLIIKNSIFAFIAFSLTASSGYILNDIIDLKSDKNNPYKKILPIASGKIPINKAIFYALILLLFSLFFSFQVNLKFLIAIILYFFLSVLYSIIIKKIIVLDVIILSSFYALRIFAGSFATNIEISIWLMSFSLFFFFSLASLKRLSELVNLKYDTINNRNYKKSDALIINSVSICSGYISILVLAFYINSPEVVLLYSNSKFLWGICFVLFYWITHITLIANRGDMHYDPIIYASKNKNSYISLILIIFFLIAGIL